MESYTILDHKGVIQYETIGELIHTFKDQIHVRGIQTGTYKKILLVMIESLENIMKHSECCSGAPPETYLDYIPVFSIRKNLSQFIIESSNAVQRQNVPAFKNRLDYLNTLDQQGIKEFYKRTITNGQFTNRGGAGLGLIEIAKISGKKIKFDFLPLDAHCDRFNMSIVIDEASN